MDTRTILGHAITALIIICIMGVGLVYAIQTHESRTLSEHKISSSNPLIYTMIDSNTVVITQDTSIEE